MLQKLETQRKLAASIEYAFLYNQLTLAPHEHTFVRKVKFAAKPVPSYVMSALIKIAERIEALHA